MSPVQALIFDFAHVLCSWHPPPNAHVPPQLLRSIMSSDIWHNYERGRHTQAECYAKVAERFPVSAEDMARTLQQARETLQIHEDTLAFLQQVKEESGGGLRVYGMTNTPHPEQNVMQSIRQQCPGLFDHIYISGNVGMRKPELCFYKYVLEDVGLPADATVFVDDRLENVLAAQSQGMNGVVFRDLPELRRQMRNLLEDSGSRGRHFLAANAMKMDSVTNSGETIRDNFAQLLILELMQDRSLVHLEPGERTWNYFIGSPKLTTETFPDDMDTTSIALSTLPMETDLVSSVIDEMATLINEDGVCMTYFDPTRPRIDPVVCVNILTLFAQHNREQEVSRTFDWVLDILLNRAYLAGTRYYQSPDIFLYFLTRLWRTSRGRDSHRQLTRPLTTRMRERIGAAGDAASLAARIISCKALGILNPGDLDTLQGMQCEDGSWPLGPSKVPILRWKEKKKKQRGLRILPAY
ncbi:hypothetical protein FE257_012845 [Aspergillus nanangensis]|uniref:HAD-like protein n=1 Tax=Aspergillus nanangensis TaxID=2582783 RepID=A0AAD4CFT8_ASPNN|nr:hypothetical protein FE257_012845 [Aspergillus nanangensis]